MNAAPGVLSRRVSKLVPYVAGEQPRNQKYVKLNTNENPFPPSPSVVDCLHSFDAEKLRLYPDNRFTELREEYGKRYGVGPDRVFVGNGSDEVLSFAFYTLFDGELLFPEHTYSFYPVFCDYYGISSRRVALKPDLSINLGSFLDGSAGGVVFANPNAPTGISLSRSEIHEFLKKFPQNRPVLIDEAYVDFGAESCADLTSQFRNLLVVQTFSKSRSLAGLRLGFAVGDPSIISALFAVKDSFNSYPVGAIAQALGLAALKDEAYFDKCRQSIIETRDAFSANLSSVGWQVLPSRTNFVFARKPGTPGHAIYSTLKEKGILVRHFEKRGISDFVRITIGTAEQMRSVFEVIRDMSREGVGGNHTQ